MAVPDAVLIGVIFQVLAVVTIVAIFAHRYKKVPPNSAMVVYGRRTRMGGPGYQIISGGGKFIIPIIESYELIPLDVRTMNLEYNDVVTNVADEPEKIVLGTTVLFKVSSDPGVLKVAAEHLLGKSDEAINEIAKGTIEGSFRQSLSGMTFDQANENWDETSVRLLTSTNQELMNVGIEVKSLTIKKLQRRG